MFLETKKYSQLRVAKRILKPWFYELRTVICNSQNYDFYLLACQKVDYPLVEFGVLVTEGRKIAAKSSFIIAPYIY